MWGQHEEDILQSQKEVEDATRRIFDECIPILVQELNAIDTDALYSMYIFYFYYYLLLYTLIFIY